MWIILCGTYTICYVGASMYIRRAHIDLNIGNPLTNMNIFKAYVEHTLIEKNVYRSSNL